MASNEAWTTIVASSLGWEQAHASFDHAVRNLAPDLRGRRPANFPHSTWELVDHIRATQHDLLEFCRNPNYAEPHWPDDYWPSAPEPASDDAWTQSLVAIKADRRALERFTVEPGRDLTAKIPPPHGTGQTFLRTILVAMDHTSYHVGQIIAVRRLLDAWPPE